MARRERREKVASVKPKKVFPNRGIIDKPHLYPQNAEDAENTIVGKDGQIYQKPTPVVPRDNAVAKDAPAYNG